MVYSYAITQELSWQDAADWQQPDTPFMSFAYWRALTETGAIGQKSGWVPLYIVIYQQQKQTPVAVLPLFIKGHHQGEYVFDHAWADAYARYGEDYYPRLVTSVPYTPVSGQRFWLTKGERLTPEIWQVAIAAIDEVATQTRASSWHGLFVSETQQQIYNALPSPFNEHKLLEREGCQFLWQNQKLTDAQQRTDVQTEPNAKYDDKGNSAQFTDFEDFLSTLTAKKRKNIRAERKKITKQNLTCQRKTDDEITAEDWAVFYQCYAMTYAVRGRHPYLTPEFFERIAHTMSAYLMLAQGLDEQGEVIASSLFFYDDPVQPNATLYGRYWGSLEEYDSLHFELCYYQGIEFAIDKGLQYFDPGTQGEHKLIRGFIPHKTHSLHRIYDARFEPAIADFCEQDRQMMQTYRQQGHEALPFNIDNMPDFNG